MARPAQSAIKTLIAASGIFLAGCFSNAKHPAALRQAPLVFKQLNDPAIATHQDTVYYGDNRFSGWLFTNEFGDTSRLIPYFDGLQEGRATRRYWGGQLEEERFYRKGKKNGSQRAWWPDGKPKFDAMIVDDAYEGEYKEWNLQGILVKEFHYQNGQEAGAQRLWYDNGNVRANYVIKNGRRFGLLGTKNCKNVSDSVPAM